MKVKFNKDLLLKHRFWVMLGVAALMIVGGIIYLELIYAGPAEIRTGFDSSYKGMEKYKGGANPTMIADMQKRADVSVSQQEKVWQTAYAEQAQHFGWAPEVQKKYDFNNGNFAIDVKLSKGGDSKTWPPDTKDLMHGTIIPSGVAEEHFVLKTRKGDVKFNRTDFVTKVTVSDESKQATWLEVQNVFAKDRVAAVTYQKGRYYNDLLTALEEEAFMKSYKDQVHEILKIVEPLDEKMNGVVQLRDWLYRPAPDYPPDTAKFIRYIPIDWEEARNGKRVSKDAWVAQEDIWIQREIYRMIRAANDELAVYTGTGGKKRDEAYVFRNPSYEAELTLSSDDTLSFKLKNRLDRQQTIDLTFRVLLNDAKGFASEVVTFTGQPLKPKGTKGLDYTVKEIKVAKSPRNGVFRVEQMLSWQTAAVKRIDMITIGSQDGGETSHSHRTYDLLRPFDENDAKNAGVVKGGIGAGPGAAPPLPGGPFKGRGGEFPGPEKIGGPGGGGGFGAAGIGGNMGELVIPGLWSFRYTDVTKQYRRIPVAVVLIVDQEHVDRVLTAFNNSKLRFLETQILLNQYLGSLEPPLPADKDPNGVNPGVPGGRGFPAFPGPGAFFPREIGPPGPGMGGGGDGAAASSVPETNMEMVIYGMMTLYQRYPEAPKPPTAPTPPGKLP